ncbi:MAG: di-trans,poly-cis-decaprenylcistransferase [Clostridia bacterium]|jgi:undecaprenyl diphosphate synthase|nr:di-trans,poly-cis-decaprenylcistransferase [Clostridia bacterium]
MDNISAIRHIAFIMDGNGRWAAARGLPRTAGHAAGAKAFRNIVEYCGDLGIRTVTVYAFSTENWRRPQSEITAIMNIFSEYLGYAEKECGKKNISVRFLGDKSPFGEKTAARMTALEDSTLGNFFTLNIAVNYGGRADIVHAVNKLISEGKKTVTEDDITGALYTSHSPAPDLIVRTGSEKRISNFLLWDCAYSELCFSDVLWPDFDAKELDMCLEDFYGRKRRYGGL